MTVGVDLIEIERVRRALEHYPSFRERCFTAAERSYCDSRPNPAQSYAGRFAGKEAVGKARANPPAPLFVNYRDVLLAARAGSATVGRIATRCVRRVQRSCKTECH